MASRAKASWIVVGTSIGISEGDRDHLPPESSRKTVVLSVVMFLV